MPAVAVTNLEAAVATRDALKAENSHLGDVRIDDDNEPRFVGEEIAEELLVGADQRRDGGVIESVMHRPTHRA